MLTIQEVHNFVRLLTDMAQNGYFSREEVDMALHLAQMRQFTKILPLYGTDSMVNKSLAPFKTVAEFETDDEGGFKIPANCEKLLAIRNQYQSNGQEKFADAPVLRDDEAAGRINSQLRKPTTANPVAEDLGKNAEGQNEYQLYPRTAAAGKLHYIGTPVAPKYAYTLVGDVETYDPANSVQPLWNDTDMVQIIYDALSSLGITLDNQMLMQAGAIKANGN